MKNEKSIDKLRWVTVGFCAYEIAAIITNDIARRGKRTVVLPTLSTICARSRMLGGLFVGGLTAHLVDHRKHLKTRVEVEVTCR